MKQFVNEIPNFSIFSETLIILSLSFWHKICSLNNLWDVGGQNMSRKVISAQRMVADSQYVLGCPWQLDLTKPKAELKGASLE